MPHIAMQYMMKTLSSALQNIFQIDAHLWRNLLFLDRSQEYCTVNISDVPDMATVADEILLTSAILKTSLLSPHLKEGSDTDGTFPDKFILL